VGRASVGTHRVARRRGIAAFFRAAAREHGQGDDDGGGGRRGRHPRELYAGGATDPPCSTNGAVRQQKSPSATVGRPCGAALANRTDGRTFSDRKSTR